MAREVQLRLLPTTPPEHTHAEIAVRFLPARTIGGDLYDFLEYGPGQTAIVLGDVSGKAAPAALFAALVSGIMRSAAQQQLSAGGHAGTLNDALQERRLDSQYVVMLFALWNDENQTLQVANSGAVQPLFCRAGESNLITRRRLSAGHVSQRHLRRVHHRHPARRRNRLRLRWHSRRGERARRDVRRRPPGADHLRRPRSPAAQIADAILADVTRFQGAQDRFDDETIIVLQVR